MNEEAIRRSKEEQALSVRRKVFKGLNQKLTITCSVSEACQNLKQALNGFGVGVCGPASVTAGRCPRFPAMAGSRRIELYRATGGKIILPCKLPSDPNHFSQSIPLLP